MKTKLLVAALFLSVGAYAQSPPRTQPEMHKHRADRTPQEREEFKAEHKARRDELKAKLAAMTPAERQAFKAEHKRKREERLAKMTPEQRERMKQRHRNRPHKKAQNG